MVRDGAGRRRVTSLVCTGSSLKVTVIEAAREEILTLSFPFPFPLSLLGWSVHVSPGGACAIGHSCVDNWLSSNDGGPTPPGLPAMVVETFSCPSC